MAEDLQRIQRYLASLARRERALLLVGIALRVTLLGLLALALLVVAAVARWDRPLATSIVVLAVGIGAWAAVLAPFVGGWGRAGDSLRQARLVEGLAPALRGRLVTAAEHVGGAAGPESPALLGRIARKAAEGSAGVAPAAVHSSRRLAGWLAANLLGVLILACAAVLSPSAMLDSARYWLAGSVAVARVDGGPEGGAIARARVGDVVLRYVYPEYTGLEPAEIENSTGDAHGPPGTLVEVRARTADPVEAAAIQAYDDLPVDVEVIDGRRLLGRFTIGVTEGTWRMITYRAGVGTPSQDFRVTPEPDLPPEVVLDADTDVLEVAVDQWIGLGWHARDDYGISRVATEIDGRPSEDPLSTPIDRRIEVSGAISTTPGRLGLQPGDEARLVVAAWDNDAVSGSKVGRSRSVVIKVLGASELDHRATERQEQLLDAMLLVLADFLEEPWPPAYQSGALARWGEAVSKRYSPLAALQDGLLAYASSQEFRVLDRVLRSGSELIRFTQVAFEPSSTAPASEGDLATTAELRDRGVVALEDGILEIARLIAVDAERRLAEQSERLANLADRMNQELADGADAQELLSRLDQLERMFEEMTKDIARLEQGGLREFMNQRADDAKSLMEEIREALAAGRLDEARELMDRLARQLQELSDGVQDNLERRVSESRDVLAEAEDLDRELEQIQKDQESLRKQVEDARRKSDTGDFEAAEKLWQEVGQLSRELGEDASAFADELRRNGRAFNELQRMRDVAEQAGELARDADNRDLDGARDQADGTRRAIERSKDAFQQQQRQGSNLQGPGKVELRQMEQKGQRIAALLEQLSQGSQRASSEAQRRVQQLQGEQQAIEERLGEATDKARELEQEMRSRPRDVGESLERAEEAMDQAGRQMGEGNPMSAEGQQRQAGQRIQDARDGLRDAMERERRMQQQMTRGGQGGEERPDQSDQGQREGSQSRNTEGERVEIPKPEWFATPEEYRRALLEGMEGEVPEEYRALKKRYFEELVQQ